MTNELPDEAPNDVNPPPMPDDLDEELFGRLLRKVEGIADAQGWNQPAAGLNLYVLYDNRVTGTAEAFDKMLGSNPSLGPPVTIRQYSAQKVIPTNWLAAASIEPHHLLGRFARKMAYMQTDDPGVSPGFAARQVFRNPGVLGFAVVFEAWERSEVRPEDRHPNREQFPDSESVRLLAAIDFLDRGHTVKRTEGTPGVTVENNIALTGISTSLRILTDMVYSRLPRPSQFAKHYISVDQAIEDLDKNIEDIGKVHTIVNGPDGS